MKTRAFTLTELLVVVAVLAAMAAIVLPLLGQTSGDATDKATTLTLCEVRDAILGAKERAGYVSDMGGWPTHLHDLLSNDHLISKKTFDVCSRVGWRGPYLRSANTLYTVDKTHGFTADYCYLSGTDQAIVDSWNHPIVLQNLAPSLLATLPANTPVVRLISAGQDGVLQTTPSDATAVGDDIVMPLARAGIHE